MSDILVRLNIAAMVVGYIVLTLLIVGVLFLATLWHEKYRYQRYRKRKNDIEWDNVRSKWLDEYIPIQRVQTVDETVVSSVDRIDTAVLDDVVEQIYDYQEDLYRDVS